MQLCSKSCTLAQMEMLFFKVSSVNVNGPNVIKNLLPNFEDEASFPKDHKLSSFMGKNIKVIRLHYLRVFSFTRT